jgi:hypothetical protein
VGNSVLDFQSLESLELINDSLGSNSLKITGYPNLRTISLSISSELESLDLSDNIELVHLDIGQAEKLTSIDLSTNRRLRELAIHSRLLSTLDVSMCDRLESLSISSECLASLDLSSNKKLLNLNVNGAKLSSLDLTNNSLLTELHCRNNQLKSLDLANNTKLETLDCSGNQLTALDLAHNMNLLNLYCGHNQLTALDVSNHYLSKLYCEYNPIEAKSFKFYSGPLREFSCSGIKLKHLDLTGDGIRIGAADLEILKCDSCELESINLYSHGTKLKYIYCHNNRLGENAMQSIIDNLSSKIDHEIYIIDNYSSPNGKDGNTITEEQIIAFQNKRSILYYKDVDGEWYRLKPSDPNAIKQMEAEKDADKCVEGIFNLSGQRLSTPQKGLNIVNGKKILIK